jgi:DNA ligase (NAD+)
MSTRQEYERLCDEIWKHNRLYFQEGKPIISDDEYDRMLLCLEKMEEAHPEFVSPTSPTQRIGEKPLSGFQDVPHSRPMLSLEKTFSKEEVEAFCSRLHRLLPSKKIAYSCELKMDGLAVAVTYEKGHFARAVTRGDGKVGSDVTQNMKTIQSLPLRLFFDGHPLETLEVRGEVYLPKVAFEKMNEERAKEGEPLWANPRNAAAGSLKLLDPQEVAKRTELTVLFYGIGDPRVAGIKSQFALHSYLKKLGLPTLPLVRKCEHIDEIMAFADEVEKKRKDLPFGIDGIVIKLDDLEAYDEIGTTGKHPRGAVAYKFSAEQAWTFVRDITLGVGRTGTITPCAELEPVFLAGSTISRATLHNFDELARKDVRVGDYVAIEKGGDVIPKVVAVDVSRRPPHSRQFHPPTHCPSCRSLLVRDPEEVALRCMNIDCPEQTVRRLIHFASKEGLDIENLGEKVMQQLYDKGFVKNFSDIFTLDEEKISKLDGFKDKSVKNLLNAIEKARTTTLARLLMALGIRYVGVQAADAIATQARTLDTLFSMKKEDFLSIEGIGEKVASSLFSYFQDTKNIHELDRLQSAGVKFHHEDFSAYKDHPFFEKTLVLTGTLKTFSRHDAEAKIKAVGGKVGDSVTKKTDFLVVGEEPGSKLEKAKKFGVTILSEDEFLEKLGSMKN